MLTNLGGSSGGARLIDIVLLIAFLAGPYVLLLLEVSAFRKSEPQSIIALILLILLGLPACYFGYEVLKEIPRTTGLLRVHLLFIVLGALAFPFTLAWEAYKRGWLTKWWDQFGPF